VSTLSIEAIDHKTFKGRRNLQHAVLQGLYKRVVTHPSHVIGVIDDCYRCLNCEVLDGGLKSGTPCSAMFEWATPPVDTGADPDVPFTGVPVISIEPMFGGSGPADWNLPFHSCALCVCEYCGVPFEYHKQTDEGDVIHGVVASTAPRWVDDYGRAYRKVPNV